MYIIYGRRIATVTPAILLVAAYTGTKTRIAVLTQPDVLLLVLACVILHIIANSSSTVDVAHVVRPLITTYFSLLMVTNVPCSGKLYFRKILSKDAPSAHIRPGAIAWRIFIIGRPLQGKIRVWPIVFAIVESSALYAMSVTAALLTFLSNSNGQYPAVDSIVPLVVSLEPPILYIRLHIHTSIPGHCLLFDRAPDPVPC